MLAISGVQPIFGWTYKKANVSKFLDACKRPTTYNKLAYVLPLLGLMLCIANSWKAFSYWQDELGSVTLSSLPFAELFSAILQDVHPPLYQIILKLWILTWGDNEPAVRLLSLIFCLCAFVDLFIWSRRLDGVSRWATLVVFATSFLFSFYAQEARSYALLLLLSTGFTTRFTVFGSSKGHSHGLIRLLFVAVALSMTHYFGLLLAAVALLYLLIEYRHDSKTVAKVVLAGLCCSTWLFVHFYYGLFHTKSVNNAWMVIQGPLDTIRLFARALLPIKEGWAAIGAAFVFAAALIVIFVCANRLTADRQVFKQAFQRVVFIIVGLLLLAIIADQLSPISTERNFIILVPSVSIASGFFMSIVLNRARFRIRPLLIVVFLITAWGVLSLNFSYYLLVLKWGPQQNWKASAQYVIDRHEGAKIYYLRSSDADETDRVFNFYIKKLSQGRLSAERIYISQLPTMPRPAILFFALLNASTIDQIYKQNNLTKDAVFYPEQSLSGTTGVFIFK